MRRDKYHDHVREALEKDGWTITHDPYFMWVGRRKGFIDLGAERTLLAAERGTEKIAVEIKSFLGLSELDDFEDALGQFMFYFWALRRKEPDRELILAVPSEYFTSFFDDPIFLEITKDYNVKMLVFHEIERVILKWIK